MAKTYTPCRVPSYWAVGGLLLLYASLAITAEAEYQPTVVAERLGPATIEADNHYSENTPVRIRLFYPAGHPRAGEPALDYDRPIMIEEWRTMIYDGLYGASRLPMSVKPQNGEVKLVLKSLARYAIFDKRYAPVPQIGIFVGDKVELLEIPQWIDADENGFTDWLEQQVNDILRRARQSQIKEVVEVVNAIEGWQQSFKRDCGGVIDTEPLIARISPACLNDEGVNAHRINQDFELTATILHEARHAWVYKNPTKAYLISPALQDLRTGIGYRCKFDEDQEGCNTGYLHDPRYSEAHEQDAEAFATRYKHLFP